MSDFVTIEEATAKQLSVFARLVLGLDLDGRENAPTLRSKIVAAGFSGEQIPDMAELSRPSEPQRPIGSEEAARITLPNGKPGYRINIHKQPVAGGDRPVAVSVNGMAVYIERGKPQEVSEHVYEVLKNAVERTYEMPEDGRGLPEPREVHSYPFSFA